MTTLSETTSRTHVPDRASAVHARGLSLHGRRGLVYGPLDLDLPSGRLTVLHGAQGGGRSSLLLTIAGRMVPDARARLIVLGEELPRARGTVQRRAAIAGFAGIDDLDEAVTVGATVSERLAWLSPWYRRTPRVDQAAVDRLLRPVYGERPLPRVDCRVHDLDEVDVMLLRIGLAMAQEPALLVVDDVDQVHDSRRRQFVWSRLEAIAACGTTVVASIASLDEVHRFTWADPPHEVFLATGPRALRDL